MKFELQKKTFCTLLALLAFSFVMRSQADVVRYSATEYGNQGIVYYLPKSAIKVSLFIEKTTFVPGELAAYAPLLLGKETPIQEKTSFQIKDVRIASIGIPDEDRQYMVTFKAAHPFSYVSLTKEGVISGINTDGTLAQTEVPICSKPYMPPTAQDIALPREYALATSKAKRAEIAANRLFELREDLMELIAGKAENAPRDGSAYELAVAELKAQIGGLERLFEGSTTADITEQSFTIAPEGSINNRTLARFSTREGLLSSKTSQGDAILFDLIPSRSWQDEITLEEAEKRERKLKGIVYNMPGRAMVTLHWGKKKLAQEELPITQLGHRVSLENQITKPKEGNVSVLFDTNTGSILSINKKE